MPVSIHSSLPERSHSKRPASGWCNVDIGSKTGSHYLRAEQELISGRSVQSENSMYGSSALGVKASPGIPLANHDIVLGGRTSAPPFLPSTLHPPSAAPPGAGAVNGDRRLGAAATALGEWHPGWTAGGGGTTPEYTSVQRSNKALLDSLVKARQVTSRALPQPHSCSQVVIL